jgi:uridine phosphorylase
MADFFIREVRATTEEPLAIIRFGSCGSISPTASLGKPCVLTKGDIVCVREAAYISRNVDHFIAPSASSKPYHISQTVQADESLTSHLYAKMSKSMTVKIGVNVSADSFYASQGRTDPNFNDQNHALISDVKERYEDALTLEMESFYLIHLAKCCKSEIRMAACAMVFAQRESNEFLEPSVIEGLEIEGGKALLDVITSYTF